MLLFEKFKLQGEYVNLKASNKCLGIQYPMHVATASEQGTYVRVSKFLYEGAGL